MNQISQPPKPRVTPSGDLTYAWILATALGLIYLVNMGFPMYGGSVANTYMTDSMAMNRSTLGAGFSLFSLCQGLSGVVVLLSIKRLGVKRTLLVGSLIILVGALLMRFAVSTSWQYVVVFGGILGLGVGFGTVLPVTTSVTLWFDKKRALAMSLVLTAGGVGGLVAAPLVDRIVISASRGWQAGWESVAVAASLSCLVTLLFVREWPSRSFGSGEPYSPKASREANLDMVWVPTGKGVYRTAQDWRTGDAMRSPTLWLFALGSLGFTAPFMLCVAHSTIHLRDLGVTPSAASMALGLLTVFSIAGRLVAGFLGDRIEPRLIWSASLFLLALGCLAIIRAHTQTWILLYTILVGMGFGGSYVCRPIVIANYFGTAAFASINGILGSILTLFSSVTPYLGGLSYDNRGSYAPTFVGVAILSLLASAGLLAVKTPVLLQIVKEGPI